MNNIFYETLETNDLCPEDINSIELVQFLDNNETCNLCIKLNANKIKQNNNCISINTKSLNNAETIFYELQNNMLFKDKCIPLKTEKQ